MTWRVVVVSSNSKLDLKLNYLVIRSDAVKKIHLSEISVLMIESTAVSMTAMLLCELSRRKIKVIFCDETHNPYGELMPYNSSHDSPDKLRNQIRWNETVKSNVWAEIVKEKIRNQSKVAARYDFERAKQILNFSDEVLPGDKSNREGHAAKVYFNTLFGNEFSRKKDCEINSCLNYGYSILIAAVNREITSLGYVTSIGIFHDNGFNKYNLGSDLMEPLRPLVDSKILELDEQTLSVDNKHRIAAFLNDTVIIDGKEQYLMNALRTYVKSVTDSLESGEIDIHFCNYEK